MANQVTRTVGKISQLYSRFTALSTPADLEKANVSMTNYGELRRVLINLSNFGNASTASKEVKEWVVREGGVMFLESYGHYFLKIEM